MNTISRSAGHLPGQRWLLALSMLLGPGFIAAATASDSASDNGILYFEKHIRPLLVKHCYECHSGNPEDAQGGLVLDRKSGWQHGGDSGAVVVPGSPDESLLLDSVRYESLEMPPSGQLSQQEIDVLTRWIKMGAPDPRVAAPTEQEEKIAAQSQARLWSLEPLDFQRPPEFSNSAWPRTDVDRYVFAHMQDHGVTPVPDADRVTWLRRVTFDLIGLPPTQEQVKHYLRDESRQAEARVVDRLLASPHFGERWGRHWLDVARYAESSGKAYNVAYPYAWRYRDYVIDAFNEDKPYNEFLKEQIAGDLLPADSDAERLEQTVATGFLALGVKDHNARNERQFFADVVDEQIDVTSRAILGMTVACARCHDHKFDPISIEDYYAMAGVFHSTEPLFGTSDVKGKGGTPNKFPAELQPIGEGAQKLHEVYRAHEKKAGELSRKARAARRDVQNLTDKIEAAEDPEKKQELEKQKKEAAKKRDQLNDELEQIRKNPPPRPSYAMAMRDREKPKNTRLHKGGNHRDLGEPVPRGFSKALADFATPEIDPKASGRVALAEWLASNQNPLTARVMTNRVWQHLFGQGIVPTPGNFGNSGKKPTHPELLDMLASRFIEQNWSVKELIRSIVLSRTYRLSSRYDEANGRVDPESTYLWRMRPKQLDAELLRDAMLFASGQLDRSRPAEGSVLAKLGPGIVGRNFQEKEIHVPSEHRSVYLPILRDSLPRPLKLFGFGNPTLVVAERNTSVVPEQSLYMLNSEFARAQSKRMAERLLAHRNWNPEQRIRRAYQLALSRRPTEQELDQAAGYLNRQGSRSERETEPVPQRWSAFCQALFASAEFRYLIDAPRDVSEAAGARVARNTP